MARTWERFRSWPTLVQWGIGFFVALLIIGVVNAGGKKSQTVASVGSATVATVASTSVTVPASTTTLFPAPRTKTSLCRFNGALPDPACTPGALNPDVSQATIATTICTPGWTTTVRPPSTVTDRLKADVAAAYGIADPLSQFEGDHLIPLELGGALADVSNFWDQPNNLTLPDGTVAAAGQKDALENELKAKVCAGQVSLLDAQRQIASDWLSAWTALGRPGSAPTTSTTAPTVSTTTTVRAVAAAPTSTTLTATLATTAPVSPANCPNGTYVNVSGNTVCSPYAAPTPPAGSTAVCNDGTYSMSQHKQGTCSGHGGVRQYLVNLP